MMLEKILAAVKTIVWFLPGFFLYAAFPPMCEVADALFALAPLMWLSRRGEVRKSVSAWTKSGLMFWIATLSWMPAIVKNGGPWPLVILGWFALAAYCTLYFAAYGYLSAKYWSWAKGPVGRLAGILFVEPILWCGLELIRSRFGGGFAWNQLGLIPANTGFGAPAALGGVYLLSAIVILVNGTIAGIIERVVARVQAIRKLPFDAGAMSKWRSLETVLAFGLMWTVYLAAAPSVEESASTEKPLRVVAVQRNFPCCFSNKERENPVDVYEKLMTRAAYLRPDLVVLPESAMSEVRGPVNGAHARNFAEYVREMTGGTLIAGGGRFENGKSYNSAAIYQGDDVLLYDKVHLVPFGEFIPGDKIFPALQKLAPVGSCTPGEVKTLRYGQIPFGVAICYEDTDSALCREFAAKGARFLCFITNDSWFSHSDEAWAHAWHATSRAIETGLPIIRVGNSGVTGFIAADGRRNWLLGANGKPLVDRRSLMADEVIPAKELSVGEARTAYVRFGDIPLAVLFALLIGGMIVVKYTNHYKRGRILT